MATAAFQWMERSTTDPIDSLRRLVITKFPGDKTMPFLDGPPELDSSKTTSVTKKSPQPQVDVPQSSISDVMFANQVYTALQQPGYTDAAGWLSTPNPYDATGMQPFWPYSHLEAALRPSTEMYGSLFHSVPAVTTTTASAVNKSKGGGPVRTNRTRTAKASTCECPRCGRRAEMAKQGVPPPDNLHDCHYPGCHKVYTKTSHLKAHLRWHCPDNQYVCNFDFCGKRFNRPDDLKKHLAVHTGANKFACPICGPAVEPCQNPDQLKKHMREKHGQIPETNKAVSHVGHSYWGK